MRIMLLALVVAAGAPLSAQETRFTKQMSAGSTLAIENINGDETIGSAYTPYLNTLASQGAVLSDDYAFIHTSAPNYGELFAGHDNGIQDGVIPPAPRSNRTTASSSSSALIWADRAG